MTSFICYLTTAALLLIIHLTLVESSLESNCLKDEVKNNRTLRISVKSKRIETGEWMDTVRGHVESNSNSGDTIDLDITHNAVECEGKRVLSIEGISRGPIVDGSHEGFRFHPRCGKNAAIINDGLTLQKLNLEDPRDSVAFTNRPLRNNEIFEVKLEKKNNKFSNSLAIGVVIKSPTDVDIIPEMHRAPVAWMYHNDAIYTNNTNILKNYGKDINQLQVGERVGVMKTKYGTLHFFVNGEDQGPAVSNVPSMVYGVFELWYNAAQATIVDNQQSSK